MTEKQYKLEQWTSSSLYYSFPDGSLHHSIGEVVARVENDLNSLYNENEQLKKENKLLNEYKPYSIKRAKKPYATIKELQKE